MIGLYIRRFLWTYAGTALAILVIILVKPEKQVVIGSSILTVDTFSAILLWALSGLIIGILMITEEQEKWLRLAAGFYSPIGAISWLILEMLTLIGVVLLAGIVWISQKT
jgi:hypothetical protein